MEGFAVEVTFRSVAVCGLNADSEGAEVARFATEGNLDGTNTDRQVLGQSEDDLDEWEIRYGSHVFSRNVVRFVVTVDQIDYHRRTGVALGQLKV